MPTTMGLMTEGHSNAMKLRAIFGKFFHTENLVHSAPAISKIWKARIADFNQKFASLPEELPPGYQQKGKIIQTYPFTV